MGELVGFLLFWLFIGSMVGFALGLIVDRGGAGFLLGLFLGPIGWIIVFLLPRENPVASNNTQPTTQQSPTPPAQKPTGDLSDDAYKIWLGKEYSITKNDLFEKYECDSKLFDSLDEALTHADALEKTRDLERQLEEESNKRTIEENIERMRKVEAETEENQIGLIFLLVVVLIVLSSVLVNAL